MFFFLILQTRPKSKLFPYTTLFRSGNVPNAKIFNFFFILISETFPMSKNKKLTSGMFPRSEEHTSELQSQSNLVCRLLLEKKKHNALNSPTSVFLYAMVTPIARLR